MALRNNYLVLAVTGLCLVAAAIRSATADDPASTPPAPDSQTDIDQQDPLTPETQQLVETLRAKLGHDSEAGAMLDDILQGKTLGPDDGWFRIAVAQTRYDWKTVARRHDRNADGKIDSDEFGGCAADFQRLDRDHDGVVTDTDLEWREHALAATPGAMLFRMSDQDGNGKVSQEEFLQLFRQLDSGDAGFVTLDDLRNYFQPPADRKQEKRPDYPHRNTLVRGLAQQEIGSLQPGPALNEPAPDFTLPSLDGPNVTLSAEIGQQPIVLIFGNFTCGPFRSHSGNLEKLYHQYRDRAKFLLVYVREAHPSDGWWSQNNQRVGIDLAQPKTDQQRCDVAGRCRNHLQLDVPFLVDTVADTVGATYSGMPNRFYLIDREGRIAFKSGRGPFGFKPGELEQSLIWLLTDPSSDSAAPAITGAVSQDR
jgi:hypothetical protein